MADKPTTYANPNLDIDQNPGMTMSPKTPNVPKIPKPDVKAPSIPKPPATPKPVTVGSAPDSKKDPIKQAEQIKNPDLKKPAMDAAKEKVQKMAGDEVIKTNDYGQWSLEKKAPKGVDPEKHESCVVDVKAKGHDVGSAHAICTSSMKKEEGLEKVDWASIRNKAAGAVTAAAITAGSLGGGGTAAAEPKPHTKFSHAYTNHAVQDPDMKDALSDVHDSGMVPIVHWDSETGDTKLTLHDRESKKQIMQFSDSKDGGYHMHTQKIHPDKHSAIKQHAQKIHDHFLKFLQHVQSKGSAKK